MTDPSYYNSPSNAIPGPLSGQYYRFAPTYIRGRNPVNTEDLKPKENQGFYPIGSFWVNSSSPPEIWVLASITSVNSRPYANWVLLANSLIAGPLLTLSDNNGVVVTPSSDTANPPGNIQFLAGNSGISIVAGTNTLTITNTGSGAETLKGDDGVAVGPDGGGSINVRGSIVANSTNPSSALYVKNTSANVETLQLQVAAAIAATDITKVGLAAFNNAEFTVDANGFVNLAGGTTAAILGIVPDSHTAPGTSPVTPTSGNVTIEGGTTYAAGTRANPIRTNSLAANTVDLEIQLAGSNPAVSAATQFGVAQFDSNDFTVTGGFVQISSGGISGAITKLLGDDGGANTVVPLAGQVTLQGNIVANAAHAKPVFFVKQGANTESLDIQRTVTSTSGAKNVNNAGLASFDSLAFSVDAPTGFVQLGGLTNGQLYIGRTGNSPLAATLTAGPNIMITNASGAITITTTATGILWSDIAASQSLDPNNGYICIAPGGVLVLTLPLVAAQGTIIEVTLDGSTSWQIAQNAGQQIRLGSSLTTAGVAGSLTSTAQGDSIKMVCSVANIKWNCLSAFGNITVA